eukprot:g22827.t1
MSNSDGTFLTAETTQDAAERPLQLATSSIVSVRSADAEERTALQERAERSCIPIWIQSYRTSGSVRLEPPNLNNSVEHNTVPDKELSARRIQLVKDAHMRAEHQAYARNTMLELAEALEQASSRRRELEQNVLQEHLVSAKLREELATWPPKVEQVKEKWEDARLKIAYWGVKASAREGPGAPSLSYGVLRA